MTQVNNPKFAVFGGCQAGPIGEWIKLLIPGAIVKTWHVGTSTESQPDVIFDQLNDYDFIVSQITNGSRFKELEPSAISALGKRNIICPLFEFPAFHPDITALHLKDAGYPIISDGPADSLFSSLILAAYFLEIDKSDVINLFNRFVYIKMGYANQLFSWEKACIDVYGEYGYDISKCFTKWYDEGCFMYTNNHPKIFVLGDLTYNALILLGLDPLNVGAVTSPFDNLSYSIQWPFFDFVTNEISISPRSSFLTSSAPNSISSRECTLESMIDLTYKFLDKKPRESYLNSAKTNHAMLVLKEFLKL